MSDEDQFDDSVREHRLKKTFSEETCSVWELREDEIDQ